MTAAPADFKTQADRIVADAWKDHGPGAAVIVTEGGRTIYATGRGLADLESKTPIRPDTVFRLGSITKQFSAAVMMQLVSEGKLSLDDPLSKFVPDYPQPGATATVRQLLNHSSGVMSYTSIPGWMVEANTNRPYSTAQMIDLFKALPPPSRPGEAWSYNNSGYVLVGAIIEKVTGKSWHQAIAERIAGPLKLRSTRYGVGEERFPKMAKGYTLDEGGKFVAAPKIHMSVPHAAGGLVGSVEDLAALANALHHGRLLKPEEYQAMTSPAKLNDGSSAPYGFGLHLDALRGMKTIGHGGGIFGFVTASTYIPEKDVFVAVFTNVIPPVTSPDVVVSKLAALAAGAPFPSFDKKALDVAALTPVLGVYKSVDGKIQRVLFEREGKLLTRSDGPATEVFAAGDNRYFYDDGLQWFELRKSSAGPVIAMYSPEAKEPELSRRVGAVPPEEKPVEVPRATLERFVGSYLLGSQNAVVTLGENGLSVKLGPQPPFQLIARGQDAFEVETAGALLTFNGESGPASSMTIKQGNRTIEAKRIEPRN
jgi:CubicO group peptidase (beta-lactamase class C family)